MAQYFGSANKGLGFYHVDVGERPDRVNHWYAFENCGVITLEEGEIEADELIRNLQQVFDPEWDWHLNQLDDYRYLVRFSLQKKDR